MSQLEKITITASDDGKVTIEVDGVTGPECERLTAESEANLGKVTKRHKKPDYYKQSQQKQSNVHKRKQ